jgi:hypothetical protein
MSQMTHLPQHPPPPGPGPGPGHQAAQRRELVIAGAHGGAGTTTVARWLSPAWDMGAMRPARDLRAPGIIAHGRPLIVCCRTTAAAAHAALTRGGTPIAALAVISDGWPEPAAATARFRLLAPQAGAVIRIPFIPALRLADDPAAVPLTRAAHRALNQIRAATGRPLT